MMVCLGNICRSPLAEGILQDKVNKRGLEWVVASSGTAGYHVGELPDSRSMAISRKHGIDISYQRSQKFQLNYFDEYDFILAMDIQNYEDLLSLCTTEKQREKVQLMMDYGDDPNVREVPDPYYGGRDGFANVYDMLDEATEGFLQTMILAMDE